MKRRRIITLMLLFCCLAAVAQTRQTTRRGLKARPGVGVAVPGAIPFDTIALSDGDVRVSGYDKPTRSTRESAFFTNTTDLAIEAVIMRLTYLDTKGRILHTVRRIVRGSLPAGSTRQLYWPTWDRQQSFHYQLSRRSRGSVSTPYTIICSPDSALVGH